MSQIQLLLIIAIAALSVLLIVIILVHLSRPARRTGRGTPSTLASETTSTWEPTEYPEKELDLGAGTKPLYRKAKYFFTLQERRFFEDLCLAVGHDYHVFAKVRMGDIMFLRNEPSNRQTANNHIRCKHFDFVLCEPPNLMPVMVIELDDSSHNKANNKWADDFKDYACETARLPLLRLPVKNANGVYDKDELFELIQEKRRAGKGGPAQT